MQQHILAFALINSLVFKKHTLLPGADFILLQGQHQREESSSKERSVSPPNDGKNTDVTEADQDKESGVSTASNSISNYKGKLEPKSLI